jgi:hypothetical protein
MQLKVKFINQDAHRRNSRVYPEVGTIGTVIFNHRYYSDYKVQWAKGSTSRNDQGYVLKSWCRIAIVETIKASISEIINRDSSKCAL